MKGKQGIGVYDHVALGKAWALHHHGLSGNALIYYIRKFENHPCVGDTWR